MNETHVVSYRYCISLAILHALCACAAARASEELSWRIMAERRRHKKRIQVTSLNSQKLLPVQVGAQRLHFGP